MTCFVELSALLHKVFLDKLPNKIAWNNARKKGR